MKRVLRPSGSIIILETLGKGYETPHPLDKLAAYYTYLEEAGFFSTWIRTDFQFKSLAEAEELTRFFFGDELADRVAREGPVTRISLNRLELASITPCHCERSEAISFCQAGIASSRSSS